MPPYRWNTNAAALAYDASAGHVHPYYAVLQDQILSLLAKLPNRLLLIVDAGGGSGRLMERILDRFPNAEGLLLDQSEPYLALACERLNRFGSRAGISKGRLQDAWDQFLPRPADAIVSMSAIHHLDPVEKQDLYARCYNYLSPTGLLLNGDEIRPENEAQYLAELERWSDHMAHKLKTGHIVAEFQAMFEKWRHRNIGRFGAIRKSGEDCHETTDVQLGYFRSAGFVYVEAKWQKSLWALMAGQRRAKEENGIVF